MLLFHVRLSRVNTEELTNVCLYFYLSFSYWKFKKHTNKIKITSKFSQAEKQCLADESSARRASRTDRTTRMLLAVLGLFLSTEVPQGLLGLASALAPDFFKNCYGMFGKISKLLCYCCFIVLSLSNCVHETALHKLSGTTWNLNLMETTLR